MHHGPASILAFFSAALVACGPARQPVESAPPASDLNAIAEPYVKLVLAVGQHDPDYVDAYYGPPEWRAQSDSVKVPLSEIASRASLLIGRLDAMQPPGDEMLRLRRSYLRTQLGALSARVAMLQGKKLTFDEETRALYDATAPSHSESYFQTVIDSLDALLPGSGTVSERYDRYKSAFVIPPARLDTVFRTAINECRRRTLRHMELPAGEQFKLEYVTNKSWSGYNWYQGSYQSLIQVNTDLPISIERAVDLACHEGYPGHHVYNLLLEKNLVRDRGWMEYTVYPLFSPQSLIAEGSANYGIDMAFPGEQRIAYERSVLWPLAGLDASQADRYYRIFQLAGRLSYAGNEAARRYLNGTITGAQAGDWLVRHAMSSPARAQQRVRFIDQYRSYVINYNLGRDMVARYVERAGGNDVAKRWEAFERLLTTPRLPGDLH